MTNPTLSEAVHYPGAPRYFKRPYDMSRNTLTHIPHDPEEPSSVTILGEGMLTIYGYSCRSTYPDDWPREDAAFERRGVFPSMCYSEVERQGEYGFTPLSEAISIELPEIVNALLGLGVVVEDEIVDQARRQEVEQTIEKMASVQEVATIATEDEGPQLDPDELQRERFKLQRNFFDEVRKRVQEDIGRDIGEEIEVTDEVMALAIVRQSLNASSDYDVDYDEDDPDVVLVQPTDSSHDARFMSIRKLARDMFPHLFPPRTGDELGDYIKFRMREVDEMYLELSDEQVTDPGFIENIISTVRRFLEDLSERGLMERLSRGRYRIKDGVFETDKRRGHHNEATAEQLARMLFPRSFRPPVRVYGRWEDAMVEQVRMYEFIDSDQGAEYMRHFQDSVNAQHTEPARLEAGFLYAVQLLTLSKAEPCYVSADMCDIIDHARHTFRPEKVLPSDPFCENGFCLFAKPIMLNDAPWNEDNPGRSKDGLTPIRAMSWTTMHTEDYSGGGFWVTFYNHEDDDPGHHEHGPNIHMIAPMLPGHMLQQTWYKDPLREEEGDDKDAFDVNPDVGETLESVRMRAREQAQFIQTLWRIGSQTVPVKQRAPRQMRRDARRRMKRELSDVNVVLLRREHGDREYEEGTGRKMKVTIMVNAYWAVRHTREGPRQVRVQAHLKGQGPFKETTRAWEFKR